MGKYTDDEFREKMFNDYNALIQEMACVGNNPMDIECIAHDLSVNVRYALLLIKRAIHNDKPIKQTPYGLYYYEPLQK